MSNRPIFTTGNNFPEYSSHVGGGRPVWIEIGKEYTGGFVPDLSAFPRGSVVQVGTPILVNELSRTAQVHIAVSLYEAATTGATTIKVKKTLAGSTLSAGQAIIPAPDSLDGTGTGLAITNVDSSNPEYDVLTLGAATSESYEAGDVFVEADKVGADAKIKVIPNALTRHDIYVDQDSKQFTCGAVIEGIIYERRIPVVIDAIKEKLVEITFSKSK